jgi:hypothetical protein
MTQPLSDFISAVRLAPSPEEERFIVSTEQAQIRAYLRKMDPDLRPRIVSKIVFLDMIGHNPAWGQMEALALMTHDRFSFKRIGYICASVLLDQTSDLAVLVTQTLLHDLASRQLVIVSLALTFIANLGSAEICRAVTSEVKKLIDSPNPDLMKRAGMATVRIIRMNPDLTDDYKNSVQPLLNSNNHGVVNAGINLVRTMIKAEPKLVKAWAQFHGPFTNILKSLTANRALKEFSFGVFNDPFMQLHCLKAISLLKKRNDELEGILQSLVSSTETKRNTGRSLLYETVETICIVSKQPSLRGLAFNQIGRLLSSKDPNILYSALSVFARVLYREHSVLNRGSADTMALQRYKSQIVKCLNHQDPSIRRRALDVISALIDETNAESLIPEIIVYLKLADSDFRAELVAKIYSAVQKFGTNNQWNFDVIHQMLIDSGNYASMEIVSSFCELIATSPNLHQHAVEKLGDSLVNFSENQTLMQVAAFVIGEFATFDRGAIEALGHIVTLPQTTAETQMYAVTALAKMATRFNAKDKVVEILAKLVASNNLEVQQRAGEMGRLLLHADVCDVMLAPIEERDEAVAAAPKIVMEPTQNPKQVDNVLGDLLLELDDAPPPQQQPPTTQSLLSDRLSPKAAQVPQQPAQPAPLQPQPAKVLLQQSAQVVQQQLAVQGAELLTKSDYVIQGRAVRNPSDPRQVALNLLVSGSGTTALSDFKMEFNPTPGWRISIKPPDKTVLPPAGAGALSQTLYLMNLTNAPFQMQVRVSYRFGAQPVTEVGTITRLPPI